jgi:protein ImuB
MSLWLPSWPTDRLRRASHASAEKPFVTAISVGSRRLVAASSMEAAVCGITPGLPLADAQAYCPGLVVFESDPGGDAAALRRLAEWCDRWSPWTAPDGFDGIIIDVTGCAHLSKGEGRLLAEAAGRVAGLGFACRAAIADTAGAAWAMARFAGTARALVAPGGAREALTGLPVAALRLTAESVAGLERLGLERIGNLYRMTRESLAQRFGEEVARRLDQALGAAGEPISPLRPAPVRRSRLAFAEPIATPEDLARALSCLTDELCRGLAAQGVGARRLELACYRVDGIVERVAIGTARPSRDPRHLCRLLAERLETIDPGLGIDDMVLSAPLAEELRTVQLPLARLCAQSPPPQPSPVEGEGEVVERLAKSPPPPELLSKGRGRVRVVGEDASADIAALATLVDRLGNRLGLANIHRLGPRESYLPERAVAILPVLDAPATKTWPAGAARPVRLLAPPEPIEATAPVPDDPPLMFRWRRLHHRVRHADGPERIAGEWWRNSHPSGTGDPGDIRDYYRVEDEEGRRFWLFRAGLYQPDQPARWFVHGVFA